MVYIKHQYLILVISFAFICSVNTQQVPSFPSQQAPSFPLGKSQQNDPSRKLGNNQPQPASAATQQPGGLGDTIFNPKSPAAGLHGGLPGQPASSEIGHSSPTSSNAHTATHASTTASRSEKPSSMSAHNAPSIGESSRLGNFGIGMMAVIMCGFFGGFVCL
ncbi:13501_t:CDS:1 [Acaulospora morrowiae]|uniref:13501_t:CDS:1 n=1 Tax=Acaulospora morrowiae TaxID=94023 RepID=A0A9N9B130_9GLOM|nr:13501_t:CDS:1 [Acaulospora morrowiae]